MSIVSTCDCGTACDVLVSEALQLLLYMQQVTGWSSLDVANLAKQGLMPHTPSDFAGKCHISSLLTSLSVLRQTLNANSANRGHHGAATTMHGKLQEMLLLQ